MATYKKRGYKPKTKKEKEDVVEENSTTAEVFNTLDEGASRTEEWVVKNQKYLLGVIGVIAVVVLGYLGYNKFVAEPQQKDAMNEMYTAKKYFDDAVSGISSDSLYKMAIDGGEGKYGMVDIARELVPSVPLFKFNRGRVSNGWAARVVDQNINLGLLQKLIHRAVDTLWIIHVDQREINFCGGPTKCNLVDSGLQSLL